MLIVGDERVGLMRDVMEGNGTSDPDFKFVEIKEGTIRLSFIELKRLAQENKTCPTRIAIVCGIHDMVDMKFDSQGKTMTFIEPHKNVLDQTERLMRYVELFEAKIKKIWHHDFSIVWVMPHPVDVETHLRLNLRDAEQDLPLPIRLTARHMTKTMNGVFQYWENQMRKDSSRYIFPWFVKFLSVVDEGSKKFVTFMKAVRAADRLPMVSVESLMPEALLDGLNPTHVTIIRLLSALKGIIPSKKRLVQHSVIEKKIIISQTETITACETDVIDKVEELVINEEKDKEESVSAFRKYRPTGDYRPTGELENEIPVIAVIAPDHPSIERCDNKKTIRYTDDIDEITAGSCLYDNETKTKDIAVDTQGDLNPVLMVLPCNHVCHAIGMRFSRVECICGRSFDLTGYNEVHSFVQMVRYTSK